ncbi:MAG: hypothetical protein ACLT2T_12915 [Bilophila wadsworthia]|uniref:hypothetical protein n=1 Tax=Bilophila wadsworthia TaxID=35833 RepID=UPI00321F83EF
MNRQDLPGLVMEALISLGGQGTIVQVCKYIWNKEEQELKRSGDLFYTWQYDMRWAGQYLRDEGKLVNAKDAPKGLWVVAK